MKNYEKYAEKIKNFDGETNFCNDFIRPQVLNSSSCIDMDCATCRMRQMVWLLEEYEEPETDWSEVEVDTPIMVTDHKDAPWVKRHFAKCENGDVYAWRDSHTSWTASNDDDVTWWKYAKLPESEEE